MTNTISELKNKLSNLLNKLNRTEKELIQAKEKYQEKVNNIINHIANGNFKFNTQIDYFYSDDECDDICLTTPEYISLILYTKDGDIKISIPCEIISSINIYQLDKRDLKAIIKDENYILMYKNEENKKFYNINKYQVKDINVFIVDNDDKIIDEINNIKTVKYIISSLFKKDNIIALTAKIHLLKEYIKLLNKRKNNYIHYSKILGNNKLNKGNGIDELRTIYNNLGDKLRK